VQSLPRLQLRFATPQNQANCNAQKFAWWAAMWHAGLVPKSLLKVRAQVQSLPRLQLRFRSSAKSIAPCRMHV